MLMGAVASALCAGAARVEEANGQFRFYRDGAAEPYAEMARPADAETVATAEPGSPFAVLEVWPKTRAQKGCVSTLKLPPLTFAASCVGEKAKALGTAGLTKPETNPGSYMFLAFAEPYTRRGVVAAWLTSRHASGVVFSGRAEGRAQMLPELQYGRLALEAGQCARNRSEKFVVGSFDDCRFGLEAYADAVAKEFDVKLRPQVSGYCTWYADRFGGAGSADSTREFAACADQKLKGWGFDFFQIDDKWQDGQSKNGPNKNFTQVRSNGPYAEGMKPTADNLRAKGIIPGLWFMPFSGNWNDPYYADKQEWFVKGKDGKPYDTAWGGTCLDFTDPNVIKYVREEVERISKDWGYKYFKYDGTWTGMACKQIYVNDGYKQDDYGEQFFDDPTVTNMEVFRRALKLVRDAAGDEVFIMSCNVSQNMRTMGGAYGLVDAIRIGPDNGASWHGICTGPIRGTARYFYNGRVWYNDPDPVYVRNRIPLSHAHTICSWAAIAGQLYAFSDWLPGLSDERVDVLRRTLAPHRRYREVRPIDLFESPLAHAWILGSGEVKVLGVFNWNAKVPLDVDYPAAYAGLDPDTTYVGWDYWANQPVKPFKGAFRARIAAADCRVTALVPFDRPRLVSASRHVCAPLCGVAERSWNKNRLAGEVTTTVGEDCELRFSVPAGRVLKSVDLPGAKLVAEGEFVRVQFKAQSTGKLEWKADFQ